MKKNVRKNINLDDIAHFMGIVTNYRMMSEELEKADISENMKNRKM